MKLKRYETLKHDRIREWYVSRLVVCTPVQIEFYSLEVYLVRDLSSETFRLNKNNANHNPSTDLLFPVSSISKRSIAQYLLFLSVYLLYLDPFLNFRTSAKRSSNRTPVTLHHRSRLHYAISVPSSTDGCCTSHNLLEAKSVPPK